MIFFLVEASYQEGLVEVGSESEALSTILSVFYSPCGYLSSLIKLIDDVAYISRLLVHV